MEFVDEVERHFTATELVEIGARRSRALARVMQETRQLQAYLPQTYVSSASNMEARLDRLPGLRLTQDSYTRLCLAIGAVIEDVIPTTKDLRLSEDDRQRAFTRNIKLLRMRSNSPTHCRVIDDDPIHGCLYLMMGDQAMLGEHYIAFLHVKCPSTGHDHILFVPKEMKTAKEARAWTFHLTPEEFDGLVCET